MCDRICINRCLEVKGMMKLDNFINMMTGHFNNKEQFDNMQREGKHILMQNTLIQSVMRKF